jgi:PAT family acetyl-CoA transporter-like MFS transporter 1
MKSHRHEADHLASEDVDMDSGFNMPHMPLHMQHSNPGSQEDQKPVKANSLEGDRGNIALLTFLYVLQGVPLGLAASIPYLLQSRQVNYKDQAIFSFVYWPFSMKLLWAPIVDSVYVARFGRRKSWLVPIQYLLGFFMLGLSTHVKWMLGDDTGNQEGVSIVTLTAIFFVLNFLAATQDIAVDGWALTMLSRLGHI